MVARALAGSGETRVWNLLVDILAQSGRYPPKTTPAGDLRNFLVDAEHRLWVHLALDRLTGELLDLQVETVPE